LDGVASLLPEGLTALSAFVLIVASFFTSALTAAVGVGGGLLMLALMTYLVPISALIPVHGLVQLGSNTGRSYVQRAHINWLIVFYFLIGSVFGALAGAALVIQLPDAFLKGLLGLFILIMVWMKLPKLEKPHPVFLGVGGLITTFITMFVGATGPLVAVFFSRVFTQHRQMVATHGMAMTVQHTLKVLAFGFAGFAFWQWVPVILVIVTTGFIGTKVGSVILNKLPERNLKLCFKFVMTLVGLDLIRVFLFMAY